MILRSFDARRLLRIVVSNAEPRRGHFAPLLRIDIDGERNPAQWRGGVEP